MEIFGNLEKRLNEVEKKLEKLLNNKNLEDKQDCQDHLGRRDGYAWQTTNSEQVKERALKELGNECGIRFFSFYKSKNSDLEAVSWYDMAEDLLLSVDSFDAERFLSVFASAERMNIIKLLLDKNYSANELLKELNFATTGKLYHHLNFLINIGVVKNESGIYSISDNMVGSIQLIFSAVCILAKRNEKD